MVSFSTVSNTELEKIITKNSLLVHIHIRNFIITGQIAFMRTKEWYLLGMIFMFVKCFSILNWYLYTWIYKYELK